MNVMKKNLLVEIKNIRKMMGINEEEYGAPRMNANRMFVINKLIDNGDFSDLATSLMYKLTQDLTIGELTDEEQELFYEVLRGKKESKYEREKTYQG